MKVAFCLLAGLIASLASADQHSPRPIEDPIPEKIAMGDLTVDTIDLIRLPRLPDSSQAFAATNAHARIQYLIPIPDDSGRVVINDTRGRLYISDGYGRLPVVFLDMRKEAVALDDSMIPNEAGLASVAFHPDYAIPGREGYGKFYTAYSTPSDTGAADYLEDDAGSHESVIREWTTDDPEADVFSGSSREVFRIGQFAPNHNIGTIAFRPYIDRDSPDYGLLYVCLGDGGAAFDPMNYGQTMSEPHGALMRIDPLGGERYGIPQDNPFVGVDGVAPEIWAYGLRHPQQFSWDLDGRLFITDIGQAQVEEVNLGIKGANYGWRVREGTFATANAVGSEYLGLVFPLPEDEDDTFTYPVAQYDHDEGAAIGSGFVYRGTRIPPLQGKYVFADIVFGRLFYIDADRLVAGDQAEIKELEVLNNGRRFDLLEEAGHPNTYTEGLRADLRMGIDAEGELYLLTKGDGWVRKIVPVIDWTY